MPYQVQAQAVLEEWRRVELQLEAAEPGSDEAEILEADARQLRDQYQDLIDEAIAAHQPEPPPFPDESPEGDDAIRQGRKH